MRDLKLDQLTAIIDSREQTPFGLGLNADDPWNAGYRRLQRQRIGEPDCGGAQEPTRPRCLLWTRSANGFNGNSTDFAGLRFQRSLSKPVGMKLRPGDWRGKITPNSVLGSIVSWISQGQNFVVAGNRDMAQRVWRSILFHVANLRFRKAGALFETKGARNQNQRQCSA